MPNPFDFSHLKPQGTAKYTLDGVIMAGQPAPVRLIGKHAGRSNAAYMNAVLSEPEGRDGGAKTAEQMDEDDRKLAKRLARYVLTGWENVPLAFTPELCEQMLVNLIDNQRPDLVRAAFIFFADADRFGSMPSAEVLGNG